MNSIILRATLLSLFSVTNMVAMQKAPIPLPPQGTRPLPENPYVQLEKQRLALLPGFEKELQDLYEKVANGQNQDKQLDDLIERERQALIPGMAKVLQDLYEVVVIKSTDQDPAAVRAFLASLLEDSHSDAYQMQDYVEKNGKMPSDQEFAAYLKKQDDKLLAKKDNPQFAPLVKVQEQRAQERAQGNKINIPEATKTRLKQALTSQFYQILKQEDSLDKRSELSRATLESSIVQDADKKAMQAINIKKPSSAAQDNLIIAKDKFIKKLIERSNGAETLFGLDDKDEAAQKQNRYRMQIAQQRVEAAKKAAKKAAKAAAAGK